MLGIMASRSSMESCGKREVRRALTRGPAVCNGTPRMEYVGGKVRG